MSGYPVSYRRASRQYRGFQTVVSDVLRKPDLKGPSNENRPPRAPLTGAQVSRMPRFIAATAGYAAVEHLTGVPLSPKSQIDLYWGIAGAMANAGINHAGSSLIDTCADLGGSKVQYPTQAVSCLVFATSVTKHNTGAEIYYQPQIRPTPPLRYLSWRVWQRQNTNRTNPTLKRTSWMYNTLQGMRYQPGRLPQHDPEFLRPGQLAPSPARVPWREWNVRSRPNPWRDPRYQRHVGPVAPPRHWPRDQPDAPPIVVPPTVVIPPTPPWVSPNYIFVQRPGGRVSSRWGIHKRLPPPKRTKEIKMRMGPVLSGVLNVITESVDLINAFYRALPRKYQTGFTPQEKALILYRHLNEISIPRLVRNIIEEIVIDNFYGRLGSATGRGMNKNYRDGLIHNRPGFGIGPWDTESGRLLGL